MGNPKPEQEWREEFSNTTYEPGSEAEKKLVRKIDLHIVPTIWVLYTLSYLDRANIGNAKSGGMEEALHLSDTEYSIVLLVFFISYVIFEVPANMLLTRLRPSYFLSTLCFVWGGVAACMAAATNYQALAGIRFCLGVVEAGFAPGIAFYLSSWYKRHELAKRFAIYYTATAVSVCRALTFISRADNESGLGCLLRSPCWCYHRPSSSSSWDRRLAVAAHHRGRWIFLRRVLYMVYPPGLACDHFMAYSRGTSTSLKLFAIAPL